MIPSWISTVRIGPLTGPSTQVPQPLQDTTRWGVAGVDEGVSVVFNGRTYIYFGDVNPDPWDARRLNMDLIAWTSDVHVQTNGGHQSAGWMFYLPNSGQQSGPASTQQGAWRYCVKCSALFWCPTGTGAGRCAYDNGLHNFAGLEFYLPSLEQGATGLTGQVGWRYCGNCNGLCWAPDGLPAGACPAGGQHAPIGWTFVLPNDVQGPRPSTGQTDWRYCVHCLGLFFDGYLHKGACPGAPGGGLRLNPVLQSGTIENGTFYGFHGDPLVGDTLSFERPGGAFVWNGQVYVFANVAAPQYSGQTRPGNPQFGTYLLSTSTPDQPSPLRMQYLFSPRIGKCTLADGTVRSHQALGLYFSVSPSTGRSRSDWRRCRWCESLFLAVQGNAGYCFGNPAGHSPSDQALEVYEGTLDDANFQSNWRSCSNCLMMVFNGYESKERCPAPGGWHDLTNSPPYSMRYVNGDAEDGARPDGGWRYCAQCQAMVFTRPENTFGGATPYVVTAADHPDLPAPPANAGITFSGQAAVIISHRFGSRGLHPAGFSLACWHLPAGAGPRLQDIQYFNPASRTWSSDVTELAANNLFDYQFDSGGNPDGYYAETSLLWLPGPRLWMMTYNQAQAPEIDGRTSVRWRPVFARFARTITELGNAVDVPIFDPSTRPAELALMNINEGYAYGAYPLERYTTWDPRNRILDLCYLLSLFRPYQVQVMRTQIRIPAE